MEARRRCGWLDEERREAERVVWVSRKAGAGGERVATKECPVSLISGESRAAVEEWLAVKRLAGGVAVRAQPARAVDGWLTLETEREAMEANRDAD